MNETYYFWLGRIDHASYNKRQGHHKVSPRGTHYTEAHSTCRISVKEALQFHQNQIYLFIFSSSSETYRI